MTAVNKHGENCIESDEDRNLLHAEMIFPKRDLYQFKTNSSVLSLNKSSSRKEGRLMQLEPTDHF